MGLWEWDVVKDLIFFDEGIADLYELTTKELKITANDWFALIHPDDINKVKKYMIEVQKKAENIDSLFRIITASKKIKFIRTQAYNIKDKNHQVVAFVGLNRDVTTEQEMKINFNKSKVFLEKIMDAIPDPVIVKDLNHNWIFGNKKLEQFVGQPKAIFIGKTDHDFFSKDVADSHWKTDDEVLKSNLSSEIEETVVINGAILQISIKKTPAVLNDKETIVVGIVRDVTEKHQANSQIRLMGSLIDSSGDIFAFTNYLGIPQYLNKTAAALLNKNSEKNQILMLLSESDQKLFVEQILPKIKDNKSWQGEINIKHPKTHEVIPFLAHFFSVRTGSADEDIYYACSASDLRALKKIQSSLIAQSKMAALGEMAAEIAHEINNPLAIIQGKAQLLLEKFKSGVVDLEKCKIGLGQIEVNSIRIKKIIDSSRAIARKSEKDPFELVSIKTVVQEAVEICRERFFNKNIDLEIAMAAAISDGDMIRMRVSEIIQVLVNLLNNSFDAVKSQVRNPWVKVTISKEQDGFEIEVIDSGKKIPQEIADRMMEPFFTTKGAGEGTGLGLSLSKQIAENHSADFYYDPKSSVTRFVLALKKNQLPS